MIHDYSKLQNGSDIRGVAMETPDGPPVNFDVEAAGRLALGFCKFLVARTGKNPGELKIAVGRDSRLSGEALEVAICQALAKAGVRVLSSGLSSTPAMFMATKFPEYGCHGSIMITASHMPPERNGMKFFSQEGGLEKQDISEIINYAKDDEALESLVPSGEPVTSGEIETADLMDTYCAHLRNIIKEGVGDQDPLPLSNLKITVDAGNGAGGFYANKVLSPLGADVSSSQFLDPDGSFPNHIPNPENKEAMASICKKVIEAKTDLGLIFDTDVDRASAVDETGKEIARNGIVAMAAALIAKECPETTVVTDSVTSDNLSKFLTENLGLKHLRFKRGYRNVIGKSIKLNEEGIDSQLAIETSGHAAYKKNYFLDDGAYLATLIVIETAKLKKSGIGISTVISNMEEPAESGEFRLSFNQAILEEKGITFGEAGDEIIKHLTEAVEDGSLAAGADEGLGSETHRNQGETKLQITLATPNYEGVRINFRGAGTDGWLLLRKSLHDPIMPLNVESEIPGGCEKILFIVKKLLGEHPELDITGLS